MIQTNKFFDVENEFNEIIEENVPKSKSIKNKTLFDHLKSLQQSYNSNYFKNESELKTFDVYMINRFLSMNFDWVQLVNYFQQYTHLMPKELVYKLYSTVLPDGVNIFLKYIKGKNSSYKNELIDIIKRYYEISKNEAISALDILLKYPDGKEQILDICCKYAMTKKEAQKLLGKS